MAKVKQRRRGDQSYRHISWLTEKWRCKNVLLLHDIYRFLELLLAFCVPSAYQKTSDGCEVMPWTTFVRLSPCPQVNDWRLNKIREVVEQPGHHNGDDLMKLLMINLFSRVRFVPWKFRNHESHIRVGLCFCWPEFFCCCFWVSWAEVSIASQLNLWPTDAGHKCYWADCS